MRVLLVDDEEAVLRPICTYLSRVADVVTATTVDDALRQLDLGDFETVVVDLSLGERRDGIWLLDQVRRRAPATRRLLLSGSPDAKRLAADVAHDVIVKPVGLEELARVVTGRP